jgi:hypothetical protein
VDTWCLDLQLAGGRRHFPRLADPVTDDERVSSLVAVLGVLGHILVDLGFERRQQHAASALAHQRIEVQPQRVLFGQVRSDYSQHCGVPLFGRLDAVRLQQPGGYAALLTRAPIHNFRL